MSFAFEWPTFSEDFYTDAREMLAQVSALHSLLQSPSASLALPKSCSAGDCSKRSSRALLLESARSKQDSSWSSARHRGYKSLTEGSATPEQALNKGEKPPIIADQIEVKELNMGTIVSCWKGAERVEAAELTLMDLQQPPELEILEIGDLSTDRFRGIFRLTYVGDAYIVLQTKVQVRLSTILLSIPQLTSLPR